MLSDISTEVCCASVASWNSRKVVDWPTLTWPISEIVSGENGVYWFKVDCLCIVWGLNNDHPHGGHPLDLDGCALGTVCMMEVLLFILRCQCGRTPSQQP